MKDYVATENLSARDLVNISELGQIRRADASNDRPAHGFVTADIASGTSGTVVLRGVISGFSDLKTGQQYFLSNINPGGVSIYSPTIEAGKIIQEIGTAISESEIAFLPKSEIMLD